MSPTHHESPHDSPQSPKAQPRPSDAELSLRRHARAGAQRMTRSCDSCRRRKIRCDAKEPACSNCVNIGTLCQTIKPSRKRGRKRVASPPSPPIQKPPSALASATPEAGPQYDAPDEQDHNTPLEHNSNSPGSDYTTGSRLWRDGRFDPPSDQLIGHDRDASHPLHVAEVHNGLDVDHLNHHSTPITAGDRFGSGESASPLNHAYWNSCSPHPWLADLAVGLAAEGVSQSPLSYMASCIALFFDNVYPTYPVLYRPTVDTALSRLGNPGEAWDPKAFTLITASCAYTLAVLPTSVSQATTAIASVLYRASRKGLDSYMEQDVETPDYTSIVIRMFHSGCIHASGKAKPSWYVLGECIRITQLMRLHDERTYERMPYMEGQLCRRAFWTLYTGDKSAAVLGAYPICLRNDLFPGGITVTYPDHIPPQDDVEITTPGGALRQMSIMDGFNANQMLWRAAEPLLVAGLSTDRDLSALADAFVEFCTCLDGIPPILAFHNTLVVSVSEFTFADQTGPRAQVPRAVAIQRTNVQVSYQCLRMVMLRTLPELFRNDVPDGSSAREATAATPGAESGSATTLSYMMAALQIAEDMLHLIHTSTPELIRLNGEACAEKIRLVAAAILELADHNPYSLLMGRARKYLEVYPHVLAMLDSKASDRVDYRGDCG